MPLINIMLVLVLKYDVTLADSLFSSQTVSPSGDPGGANTKEGGERHQSLPGSCGGEPGKKNTHEDSSITSCIHVRLL